MASPDQPFASPQNVPGIPRGIQNRFVTLAYEKLHRNPNNTIVEIKPNRKRDKEIYTFSGNDDGVANQISLFLALNERDKKYRTDIYTEGFEDLIEELLNIDHYGSPYISDNRIRQNRLKIKLQPVYSPEISFEKGYQVYLFYPNKDNLDDWITVFGQPLEIIYQITSFLRTRRQLDDVARVSGMPVSGEVNNNARFIPYVKFTLTTKKSRPYRQLPGDTVPFLRKTIKLPWPKLSALTFENIKNIFGKENGIVWGEEKVTAWVADDVSHFPNNKNGMPQVWCGGSDFTQAKSKLKEILTLSSAKIVRINKGGKDASEGLDIQDPEILRSPYKVYLKNMVVLNATYLNVNSLGGRRTLKAKIDTKYNDFDMSGSVEPYKFRERLEDLLKIRT